MSTDWKALCEELAREVELYALDRGDEIPDCVDRARAALAEPVGEGPTDEEIMGLMPPQMHEDLAAAVRAIAEQEGIDSTPAKGVLRIMLNRHCVDLALAALARWGHQPAPPAEGEVAELVEWLRDRAESTSLAHNALRITRAADLLERQAAPVLEPALAKIRGILNDSGRILQTDEREALELARQALEQRQAAPVAVAVSERLPDASDSRECRMPDGDCWWFDPHADGAWYMDTYQSCYTHWLPATALPLPAGEVQP